MSGSGPKPKPGVLRLTPGTIFAGDYKIIKPLRAGGQGSLYVVEQMSTSKQRALKLMLPELVAHPSSRRRFELEAKIAARIESDHVVASIASGVDASSGTPWLVMELLEGQDLAAYTSKKKHLPPGEVLEIFSQLCHALGEAHEQGIVHRDLKPENIFLSTPRRRGVPFMVKVLDFGIARIVADSQTLSGATSSGLGTPMWMAPEQTMPGGPVAPCTDVWPLGLLAFRLLTGYLFWKSPYDTGASVMMLMAEAFMHPVPPASVRAAHYKCKDRLPPGFDKWFAKCVARTMEDRFANAGEAFAALEPLLAPFAEDISPSLRASSVSLAGPPPSSTAPVSPPAAATTAAATTAAATTAAPASERPPPSTPAPAASPPVEGAARSVPSAPAPATGPGLATWGGVPELPQEELISSATAKPAATPTPPSAEYAAHRLRRRILIVCAALLGVILGALVFGLRKRTPAGSTGSARATPATASAAPIAPSATAKVAPSVEASAPPAPSTEAPDAPSASASAAAGAASSSAASSSAASSSAASSSAASASSAPHASKRLCKPAGLKCFGNDDCCDRACRKWICRENAALHDPY